MFNIENFDIKLDTEYIGRTFIYAEELSSTNTYLMDKQNEINTNGTVVLAETQTQGKGRKDRVWFSLPESNLTFSILLTNNKSLLRHPNIINFAASIAVSASIEKLFQIKTDLKWPNDVLLNGKKTSGILLESSSLGNNIVRLVVGIGINVNQNSFQGTFNHPPTSIRMELGRIVEREKLLSEVLNNFEILLLKIEKDSTSIIEEWKTKCNMIGERISIVENDSEKFGIFYDVDEEGFLLLKTKDGIEKVHYGDVSLR